MSKFGYFFFLAMAWSVAAQTNTRTLKAPTAAQKKEMLSHLKARLSDYERHLPAFVCAPLLKLEDPDALEGSRVLPDTVILDLRELERGHSEQTVAFSTEPLLGALVAPDAKFVFERWAMVRRRHVAVYRYKTKAGPFRQAEAHVDRENGSVSEIVFHGVDTPKQEPLYCRAKREDAK